MSTKSRVTVPRFFTGCCVCLVIVLLPLVLFAYLYFSGSLFSLGLFPCSPPPSVMVDGEARAYVETWNDLNGDGIRDTEEPPLPWVTIRLGYSPGLTGMRGRGAVEIFKPGCPCRCWEGERVVVTTPAGYRATTPTELELTGENLGYHFGFQLDDGSEQISFAGEPDWFQAFTHRGVQLTAFHYSDADHSLAISINGDIGEIDQTYRDIFNVVYELHNLGIFISQIAITSEAEALTFVCDMDTVGRWKGKLSYAEIVASHCQQSQP